MTYPVCLAWRSTRLKAGVPLMALRVWRVYYCFRWRFCKLKKAKRIKYYNKACGVRSIDPLSFTEIGNSQSLDTLQSIPGKCRPADGAFYRLLAIYNWFACGSANGTQGVDVTWAADQDIILATKYRENGITCIPVPRYLYIASLKIHMHL